MTKTEQIEIVRDVEGNTDTSTKVVTLDQNLNLEQKTKKSPKKAR